MNMWFESWHFCQWDISDSLSTTKNWNRKMWEKKSILEEKAIERTQTEEERRRRVVFSFHRQKIPPIDKEPLSRLCNIRDGVIHLCSAFLTAQSWINHQSLFALLSKTITEKHGIKYVFIWNSVSQSVISSVSQFERVWKGGATFP